MKEQADTVMNGEEEQLLRRSKNVEFGLDRTEDKGGTRAKGKVEQGRKGRWNKGERDAKDSHRKKTVQVRNINTSRKTIMLLVVTEIGPRSGTCRSLNS